MKIKIKLFSDQSMPKIIDKGEWIDLKAAEDMFLRAPQSGVLKKETINGETVSHRDVIFDVTYIPLGVAMKLPKGFEAVMLPRSSTPKKFGIMCANSQGVIDNSYSGNGDEWMLPVITLRDTQINKGTRICQFRIQLSQKATRWQKLKWLFSSKIKLVKVDNLDKVNRSGFGSTGI